MAADLLGHSALAVCDLPRSSRSIGSWGLAAQRQAWVGASDPAGNVLEWVEEPVGGLLRQLIQRARARRQRPAAVVPAPDSSRSARGSR